MEDPRDLLRQWCYDERVLSWPRDDNPACQKLSAMAPEEIIPILIEMIDECPHQVFHMLFKFLGDEWKVPKECTKHEGGFIKMNTREMQSYFKEWYANEYSKEHTKEPE